MRGEVIHYDEAQGFGFITGADGGSYSFRREDLRRAMPMAKGMAVEFQPSGGQAKGVFTVGTTPAPTPAAAPQPTAAAPATPAPPLAAAAPRAPAHPVHYGRYADNGYAGTSLWDYFVRALTTNYARFSGRARRKEYWGFILFWTIGFCAIVAAAVFLDSGLGNMDEFTFLTTGVSVIIILGTLIPGLAITIRRIHDLGLSGWLYLLAFIPYIGSMIIFVFTVLPSQTHDNKYGPVPDGIVVPPPFTPTVRGIAQ